MSGGGEKREMGGTYRESGIHMPSSTQQMLVFMAPMSTIQALEKPAPKVAERDSWKTQALPNMKSWKSISMNSVT